MLAKKERLNRTEFNRFFTSGKRYQHRLFTLIYVPHPTFHGSVVVSKKISAKAVNRNKLRRRAYEALRNVLHGKYGGVFIIIMKNDAQHAPYSAFTEALRGLLGRIEEAR